METEDGQQVRAARNQSMFRQVNERLELLGAALGSVTEGASFSCECARTDCLEELTLTLEEYERIRASSVRFVVAHGHVLPTVEVGVEKTDGVTVVAKIEAAREVAAGRAPRGPANR